MGDYQAFLAEVKAKKDELKCSTSGCWYRGVSNFSHGLVPKLIWKHRKLDTEGNLFRGYLRTRMANTSPNSWINLIDMQHYGTATRLLDWTDCFGVALYFALSNTSTDTRGIWLLNPFTLACRARGTNEKSIGDFHIDPDMDYYSRFIRKRDWPYRFAMPFFSPTPNERIRAQRGFFTVHGIDERSIHLTATHHVRYVPVPPEICDEAREFLSLAGIDDNSLFPDHDGWLRMIERDYFYRE